MKPKLTETNDDSGSFAKRASANGRTWAVRSLLLVLATALGCSLLTSLDFVGHPQPDAGIEIPNTPDGAPPDASDCEEPCTEGRVCIADHCSCPPSSTECEGTCMGSGPLEDAGYCGTCGNKCRGDQHCSDGGCDCGAGLTDCATGCVDVSSDPAHCGSCEKACQADQRCIQGTCKSSPCDDFCSNPEILSAGSDGFRKDPLGTEAHCFSVKGYRPDLTNPRIVCWNFESGRTLSVNGKPVECATGNGYALTQEEMGWYCIQASAGGAQSAGFVLPTK